MKRPSGRHPLEIKGLSKSYGDTGHQQLHRQLSRGEKIALIGRNGAGKTTMLRSIVEKGFADAGTAEWGHEVSVGYFSQDHRESIPNGYTLLEWLHSSMRRRRRSCAGCWGRCCSPATTR